MLVLPYLLNVTRLFYMYIIPVPLLLILYMIVYLLYSLLNYSFPQIVNSLSIVYYTVYGIYNSLIFTLP